VRRSIPATEVDTDAGIGRIGYREVGYAPVAADFNSDGRLDLATISTQGFLQMLLGNGDGTFEMGSISSIGQYPNFFATADLIGNGAPDLVVPNYLGGEVSILLNQCVPE
jgi:hypothetical protein